MKAKWYRYVVWGDRRHWELTVGRTNISAWCAGAPCHLTSDTRHKVSVRRFKRSMSAVDR